MSRSRDETRELIKQCKEGDERAQLEVYRYFAPRVYGSAVRILKDESEAEDAMQEAFIKAFSKIHTYNEEAPFEAWLRKIVTNEALGAYRKRKRRNQVPLEPEILPEDRQTTESPVEHMMVFEKVTKALERLKENYRLALTLFLIEEYKYEEISEYMGISYGNCRTLISRAKQQLKNELADL